VAENRHLARSRLQQALENLDGRGLPCPIRTEQPEALARLNLKIQSTHGLNFAVIGLAQIATLDGNSHAGILTYRLLESANGTRGMIYPDWADIAALAQCKEL
jgi:hypothetical protein